MVQMVFAHVIKIQKKREFFFLQNPDRGTNVTNSFRLFSRTRDETQSLNNI